MIQATNFIELNKHCSSAIKELNAALTNFSGTFRNLPVSELIKNKRISASVKEKAAWYACMVNPNIDVLLLPDYFETKQCRNILLKKETEQFQTVLNQFNEIKSLGSNVSVYENLFTEEKEERSEFDLFSRQTVSKEKCPEPLVKLFNQWLLVDITDSDLEKVIYQFCDWHGFNNFSFKGQRHLIVWLNYQLWKLYGDAGSLFNIEEYFFHHWNRESRSNEQSVLQLIAYIQNTCMRLQAEIKTIYREEIGYGSFESQQKIANNFIYHTGFNFPSQNITQADDYSVQLNKIMLKKGFVKSTDINFRVQLEKVKLTLQNWYKSGLINVVFDDSNWFAYILPVEQKSKRLSPYCNLEFSIQEPDWDLVFAKPIISIQIKEKPVEELPKKVSRQKAFFG